MIGSARYWREVPQRYRYEAAQCTKCDKTFFPPRLLCSECRGREFKKTILPHDGTVETFTVIRVAPSGFTDEAPYAVGIVKLSNGVKLTTQIVDCDPDKLEIGDKVHLEFRRIQQDGESGILCYGYKFVPETMGA
jgi:uncharacterized OB-fold protein